MTTKIDAAIAQAREAIREHGPHCAGRGCLIAGALLDTVAASTRIAEQRDAAEGHLADRKTEIVDALGLPAGRHKWRDLIDRIRLLREGPALTDNGRLILASGLKAAQP